MELTKREREIIDIISQTDSVKLAARKLGISPKTVYNTLAVIRSKYTQSRTYTNQILAYRKKSPRMDKLLTPLVRVKEEETQTEEESKGGLEW